MIIVMQSDAGDREIEAVEARIRAHGLDVHVSRGTERTLIGAIGDERKLAPEMFETMPGVERSLHILKPYKVVAREWHKASTIIDVRGAAIGGSDVQMIAGPCSVETPAQMNAAADAVAAGGARLMRGGAFKPRTSPVRVPGQGRRRPGAAAAGGGSATICRSSPSSWTCACSTRSSRIASTSSRSARATCRTSTC